MKKIFSASVGAVKRFMSMRPSRLLGTIVLAVILSGTVELPLPDFAEALVFVLVVSARSTLFGGEGEL